MTWTLRRWLLTKARCCWPPRVRDAVSRKERKEIERGWIALYIRWYGF